jgi:chemotaxis protein histidine kinase CheA
MSLDADILNDFFEESNTLIEEMLELLESMEGDFSKKENLKVFANKVDRIMGAAASIAMMTDQDNGLNLVTDYTLLCKVVAYKAAEIQDNSKLYDVTVAVLIDAIEALNVLVEKVELPAAELKKVITPNFIERLRWVSDQFTKQSAIKSQSEIDDLMKKLGF